MKMEIAGKILKFELTDEEFKAATWIEFDDASLGKLVKATALMLQKDNDAVTLQAIATLMATTAHKSNAENMKLTVEGVTYKEEKIGDYEIVVRKKK